MNMHAIWAPCFNSSLPKPSRYYSANDDHTSISACETHCIAMCLASNKNELNYATASIIFNSLRPSDAYMRRCLTTIASDNGLSPGQRQVIIWTNSGILLIGPLGTNFSEISIEIHTFLFKKMHEKVVCEMAAILSRGRWVNVTVWQIWTVISQQKWHYL